MSEVMEQIGRMSRAEQIRIARLIPESIESGEVQDAPRRASGTSSRIGLMEGMETIPSFERDRELDGEIVNCCDFEVEVA